MNNLHETWLAAFQKHSIYGHKRFKILPDIAGHLRLKDHELFDIVDKSTFKKLEPHRLPVFMGGYMGVGPGVSLLNTTIDHEVAVIARSPLSGAVAGMRIWQVKAGDPSFTMTEERKGVFFSN
jgi:hypothetical protein